MSSSSFSVDRVRVRKSLLVVALPSAAAAAATTTYLPPSPAGESAMDRDGRPGWLSSLGFTFLSFNCGMAIYRSIHDPYSVAFVVVAYLALILLFRCLHLLERDAPGRRGRGLKAAVWALATLLTFMFSYKVAAVMPRWGQALVWAMAILTTVAGFYAFFVARQEEP